MGREVRRQGRRGQNPQAALEGPERAKVTPTETLHAAVDAMGRDEGKLEADDVVVDWVVVVSIQSVERPGTSYLTLMSGDLPRHSALGLTALATDELIDTHYDDEG